MLKEIDECTDPVSVGFCFVITIGALFNMSVNTEKTYYGFCFKLTISNPKVLFRFLCKNSVFVLQEKKKELLLNLEEYDRRIRMKSVGNIRFIGK